MSDLTALVVDFGGVLTGDLRPALGQWMTADDVDPVAFAALMREWHTASDGSAGHCNPLHALETGELPGPDFERTLADALPTRTGGRLETDGLLRRMFAAFAAEPDMYALLARARAAGVRTALLSNSWANDYPPELATLFDVQVISGAEGLRKPDPAIYLLTAERLGVRPEQCVFVDDLAPNVRAAVAVGMVGIRHTDAAGTVAEVETLFGWPPED